MSIVYTIKDGDWDSVRQAIQKIVSTKLGPSSSPTFLEVTISTLAANSIDVQKASVGSAYVSSLVGVSAKFTDVYITAPNQIYLLSHDLFADFVADEHVAHSGVVVTANAPISGGGSISVSRTLSLAYTSTLSLSTSALHVLTSALQHDSLSSVHQSVVTTASPTFANVIAASVSVGTLRVTSSAILGTTTTAYSSFNTVGLYVSVGSARTWEDVRVPGYAFGKASSAPSMVTVGSSGLQVHGFSGAALNQVFFNIQLPHSYAQGTDIYPHVHWMPATTVAGDIQWNLEYSWTNIGEATVAANTIVVVASAAGTAYYQKMTSFAAITGAGRTISSNLLCRLYRNGGAGSDTYTGNALAIDFDIHVLQDTLGSSAESSK